MATTMLEPEAREDLRSKLGTVAQRVANPVGGDGARAWYSEVEDSVLALSGTLPAGVEDYEARQLLRFMTELRQALDAGDSGAADLAAMRMGDVVRRLERRLEHAALEDPDEAASFVFEQLSSLSATDLASLLGVTTKTVGNWKAGKPVKQKVDRVRLIAQLVSYLRHSMTPTGLLMWFENPADQLKRKSPLQLIDADVSSSWLPLVSYARGGRGQLAS
jgi:DNA-binding transcriptional regulator YiaG